MDSLASGSNESIGNIIFTVNELSANGNALLPCDGSKYLAKEYPVLASLMSDEFKFKGVQPTENRVYDWVEYIRTNSTIKVVGLNVYIFVCTHNKIGVITSNDGGVTFSDFTPFSSLMSNPNAPFGAEIKCSESAEVLLICKGWYSFISQDMGVTWRETHHYSGSVASYNGIYKYDVSPSGGKFLLQSGVYNTNVYHMRSTTGGVNWQNDITTANHFSAGTYGSRFGFYSENVLLFQSGVYSAGDVVKVDFDTLNTTPSLTEDHSGTFLGVIINKQGAVAHSSSYSGTYSDSDRLFLTLDGTNWTILPRLLYGGQPWAEYQLFGTLYDFVITDDGYLFVSTQNGVFRLRYSIPSDQWVKVYSNVGSGLPLSGINKFGDNAGKPFIFSTSGMYLNITDIEEDFEFKTPSLTDDAFAAFSKVIGDKI